MSRRKLPARFLSADIDSPCENCQKVRKICKFCEKCYDCCDCPICYNCGRAEMTCAKWFIEEVNELNDGVASIDPCRCEYCTRCRKIVDGDLIDFDENNKPYCQKCSNIIEKEEEKNAAKNNR